MSGYQGLGRIQDPATQAVCKALFDQTGALLRRIAELEASALTSGSPYQAGGTQISDLGAPQAVRDAVNVEYLRQYVAAQLALAGGGGTAAGVDPNGALDASPLLGVRVDGSTVIINGSNRLEAPAAAGGITQLTGDGTAGPGSGSVAFTLANSGVSAATYGSATQVPQFAVDAKGRVTSVTNVTITGGTSSGTAFPGSPSTGDRFWRSDRNIEYVYDGTRWLSTVLYRLDVTNFNVTGTQPKSATTSAFAAAPWAGVYDLYIETGLVVSYNSTVTATNYFTFQFSKWDAGTQTNIGAAISGQGNTINTFVAQAVTINAVVSGAEAFDCTCTETATCTSHIYPVLTYRLIG